MKAEKTKNITITMEKTLADKLARKGKALDLAVSQIIRRLVREYLTEEENATA